MKTHISLGFLSDSLRKCLRVVLLGFGSREKIKTYSFDFLRVKSLQSALFRIFLPFISFPRLVSHDFKTFLKHYNNLIRITHPLSRMLIPVSCDFTLIPALRDLKCEQFVALQQLVTCDARVNCFLPIFLFLSLSLSIYLSIYLSYVMAFCVWIFCKPQR